MPSDNKIEASASATPAPKAADKILDVARDLFYREGIRAIGVDEIVNRAGVTKPSLYRRPSMRIRAIRAPRSSPS